MSQSERKLIELEQKLSSLDKEFCDWRTQSEARQLLEKHYTQIRRITTEMAGYCGAINQLLGELRKYPGRVLAEYADVEGHIVEVHCIWDFFRGKFLQRCAPYYQGFLYPADEFAWACYEPARRRAVDGGVPVEKVKEPPLVYFHLGANLLATGRNRSYAEGIVRGELPKKQFIKVVKPLPIPLIGVPWFQIQHLPETLVIGHEVGHHVQMDFGLFDQLRALLGAALHGVAPESRQRQWRRWLGEIFADVYGNLAAGAAFVGALLDFLSGEARQAGP
jgi:hypothetical protein